MSKTVFVATNGDYSKINTAHSTIRLQFPCTAPIQN